MQLAFAPSSATSDPQALVPNFVIVLNVIALTLVTGLGSYQQCQRAVVWPACHACVPKFNVPGGSFLSPFGGRKVASISMGTGRSPKFHKGCTKLQKPLKAGLPLWIRKEAAALARTEVKFLQTRLKPDCWTRKLYRSCFLLFLIQRSFCRAVIPSDFPKVFLCVKQK